jgi:predicted alpha-1,2-mannosidase
VAKNVKGFYVPTAYEGIRKNGFENPPDGTKGRPGLNDYAKLGYVPGKRGYAVSQSLDYAYDDWCVAQVAKALGKTEDHDLLAARSQSYRKLWDPSVGFFRARTANGEWDGPFDEFAWGDPYVEGGAWQCTWAAAHDVAGLAQLMGGEKSMGEKLDRMLGLPPAYTVGSYGQVIHEMTEMAVARFGQYAHSNQPAHHVLYLYAAIGQPWKTQYWTRKVCSELYNAGPQGFCGDEDNGEMSCWYLLSAMGIFPLCPGDANYTLTSPLFDSITLALPDGKSFVVSTTHNGPNNAYVQSRTLNGQPFTGDRIPHDMIRAGGQLKVDLGPRPAAATQSPR